MANYFHHLDQIQVDVYDKLTTLLHTESGAEKSQLLSSIHQLLLKYLEYVLILKSKLSNEKEENKVVLLNIYEEKLIFLKEKVRDYQLKWQDLQNERIHQLRIEKYHLIDEPTTTVESDRNALFSGRSDKITSELSLNQQILQQNKKITASLLATRQLMSTSILQTELNIDSLDQQTKDLSELNQQYIRFNDLLSRSKQIVNFIEKQDKQDKRRIYMSLGFFVLVCSWIIWKRILRGPVRLLLWSLFKVFRIFNFLFASTPTVPSSVISSSVPTILSTVSETISTASEVVEVISGGVDATTENLGSFSQSAASVIESLASLAETITLELSLPSEVADTVLQASSVSESYIEPISTLIIESSERIIDEL